MSWEKVKLADTIEKPISGEWGEEGNSVFVLRTTNFTNDGTLDLTDVVKRDIPTEKVGKKKLVFGDTIIEKSGGSPNQPVGRVVYFNIEKQNGTKYLCNNFTSILRPKNNVNSKYLFWFLFYNHASNQTLRYQNKTTGIINLQTERYICELKIPLPELSTQQKIAAILDKADELRKKDQQLLAKYDELLQAVFYDMFGDPVKNEKGWEVKKIKDIAKNSKNGIKAGPFGSSLKKEYYVEKGYKIYGQEQVIRDNLSYGDYYITEKKYKELENCKIESGDILISLVGTYGKISVVPDVFEPGIINPRLMKVSPNRSIIHPEFLKKLLINNSIKQQIDKVSRGGTMDIVNVGIMKEVQIPVPPLNLQNMFVYISENIGQQKYKLIKEAEQSEKLFQSLLQRAFKGELVQ